jgi:hypothetical protein
MNGVDIYLDRLLNRPILACLSPWCRGCSSSRFLHLFAMKMVVSFLWVCDKGVLMGKL